MKLRKKLPVIFFLSALAVMLPGLAALYYLTLDKYLEKTFYDLRTSTYASSTIPIDHMRRAESSLKTLAQELILRLEQPPSAEEIIEFDHLVSTDEFGVIRNNPILFDGARQAGVFIPADVDLTDTVKRTKLRAMKLLSTYGQAALQFFDGVWFDQADKTSVIFWRRDVDFIYKLPPDHDYTQSLWDRLASPELNAERIPKWTPAIYESPVGTWVVSCVYPVDIKGQWLGVLGLDIALSELLEAFKKQDNYQSSQHFLIDAYGNYILAGPWQYELEHLSGEFKPDLSHEPDVRALLNSKQADNDISPRIVALEGQKYMAVKMLIKGLNWKYVRLVALDEIIAPVRTLFYSVALLVTLIIVFISLLMYTTVRKMLMKPLLNFADMLHQYGKGSRDLRLDYQSSDELGEVAGTINDMADNIQSQRQLLIRSRDRYQLVVNSIKEVIFRLDDKGRIIFINDAWQVLSGMDRYTSFHLNMTDFFHPDSVISFQQAMTDLLDNTIDHYQADIKLENPNNQFCWVEVSMQTVLERDKSQRSITGNMSDISERKYTQLVDELIDSLEKEALQGHSIVHILGLFCFQLADIFAIDLVWVSTLENNVSRVLAAAGGDIHNLHNYNTQLFQEDNRSILQDLVFNQQNVTEFSTEYCACLAIPITLPAQDTALVFMHTQQSTQFAEFDKQQLQNLIKKISFILELTRDHEAMLLYRTAIENTANAIFITDRMGLIEWCNQAFSQLTGYSMIEIIGKDPCFLNSGMQSIQFFEEMWQRLNNQKTWRGEIINKHKNGSFFTAVETITPLVDLLGVTTHFIAVQEDISDLKAAEQQNRYLATHDFLTQLPNRFLFNDHLQHAIDTAQRHKQQHAVLFMDLDGFKTINDSLGHNTGDQILKQLAHRLLEIVRKSDTVARIGGDEFVILLEDIRNITDVTTIAQKVLYSFADAFDISGNHLHLTTSLGIALYPDDHDNVDDLLRCADAAMYHAKALGRNNSQFYTQEINDKIETRMLLERDLHAAIDGDQLELHYQPQTDLKSAKVIGMEALVRWNHPQKGLIPPNEFIPFAEESGLIVELGNWVLTSACQQAYQWHQAGYDDLTVSVNISVRQLLHSDFISSVTAILQQAKVNPKRITFELTESIMLNQPDRAVELLTELKTLGVNLSIDDFGTGYSSLQYLRLLPIDELKIDQSFIGDIHHKEGKAIVNSICALGQSMGLSLLAEGVEDPDTPSVLMSLGCYYVQGYLYSKPLTVQDADAFLSA